MLRMERDCPEKVTIEFSPIGKRVEAFYGQSISDAAKGMKLFEAEISAPCGGRGLCARCLVRLVAGTLSPVSETEQQRLSERDIQEGYRLACQALVTGPCKVEIPQASLVGHQQLGIESQLWQMDSELTARSYTLHNLRKTDIGHPHSLWQQIRSRLMVELGMEVRIDLTLLRKIDPVCQGGDLSVTILGNEIVSVTPADAEREPMGLAIDLGTTKMAVFLVNLITGSTIASAGMLNPQISHGEDVISRIVYAIESETCANNLQSVVVMGINQLIQSLISQTGIITAQIRFVTLVANTAMHHLLLNLPVRQLAFAPYVPVTTIPIEFRATDIGLALDPSVQVYVVPPVGGFVGGDHVAMILGSEMDTRDSGISIGVDIGTNTEIVLAKQGQLVSCSCASGPAFEGAHIYQGMRAVDGAICNVKLLNQGQDITYQTIGSQRPLGICGSGVLDLLAELNKWGIILANGRLDASHPRVRKSQSANTYEFLVADRQESGTDSDIVLTQKDISEIQLAKAAIASGIEVLLEANAIAIEQINSVIVAGAFGTFLRVESAIGIGMLPNIPQERFLQVGNAAGVGARMILLSYQERKRAEELAQRIQYKELAGTPAFNKLFGRNLTFPKGRK